MIEPTEAELQKACDLLNAESAPPPLYRIDTNWNAAAVRVVARLIASKPVDPLRSALEEIMPGYGFIMSDEFTDELREQLEKRGLHITEIAK